MWEQSWSWRPCQGIQIHPRLLHPPAGCPQVSNFSPLSLVSKTRIVTRFAPQGKCEAYMRSCSSGPCPGEGEYQAILLASGMLMTKSSRSISKLDVWAFAIVAIWGTRTSHPRSQHPPPGPTAAVPSVRPCHMCAFPAQVLLCMKSCSSVRAKASAPVPSIRSSSFLSRALCLPRKYPDGGFIQKQPHTMRLLIPTSYHLGPRT